MIRKKRKVLTMVRENCTMQKRGVKRKWVK